MMVLIDTDILIDVTRDIPHAIQRLTEEVEQAVPIISSITRKELLMGCRNKEEVAKILNFLTRFSLQRLTPAIDALADRLLETYYLSHGLMIPDALIAATALELKCPLLSKNQKDFRFINSLVLIPYP